MAIVTDKSQVKSPLDTTGVVSPPLDVAEKTRQEMTASLGVAADTEKYDKMFDDYLSKMDKVASAQLSGVIPDDVSAQVRRISAERGGVAGVLGQAGRALTARDLGLTSLQLQQQGMASGQALSQLSGSAAESRRNYGLQARSLLDTVRRTDLAERELDATIRQQRVTNLLNVNEMIGSALDAYHGKGIAYAQLGDRGTASMANLSTDFTGYIKTLRELLQG